MGILLKGPVGILFRVLDPVGIPFRPEDAHSTPALSSGSPGSKLRMPTRPQILGGSMVLKCFKSLF